MKRQKTWVIPALIILGLLSLVWAGPALAGAKSYPVAVFGEIQYLEHLNGYVVQGVLPDEPGGSWGQYFIQNPKPNVLNKYAGTGRQVTVQGKMKEGSSVIFKVNKIDGRRY